MRRFFLTVAALCAIGVDRAWADDQVLVSESFATLGKAWSAGDGARASDGKLVMEAKADKLESCMYSARRFTDVDVRVTATQTKGDGSQFETANFVFWFDNNDNYYLAGITSDGDFSVKRAIQGVLQDVVSLRSTELIRSKLGQSNTMQLLTRGDYGTLTINDRQVAAFNGAPPKNGGYLGLIIGGGEDRGVRWEFTDFTIRSAPTLSPGDLIFAEDFSTLDPLWTGGDGRARVENQQLLIEGGPESLTNMIRWGRPVGDSDVRLKLTQTKGSAEGIAGITFWADVATDFYAAVINGKGEFAVFRHSPRGWSGPGSWTKDSAIKAGLGQTNDLRVVTQGTTATFYVNGKELMKFRGSPTLGCAKVGVHTQPQQEVCAWAFSDLQVRKAPTEGGLSDPKQTPDQYFVDDFARFDPSWGAPTELIRVENNAMILQPPADNVIMRTYEGDVFADVDIRTTVTLLEGDPAAVAGIVFWRVSSSMYCIALVRPDGAFILRRIEPDGYVDLSEWKASDAIKGVGKPVELHLRIRGDEVTFWVGSELVILKGTPPSAATYVGFAAQSLAEKSNKWSFSKFDLRKVERPKDFPDRDDF